MIRAFALALLASCAHAPPPAPSPSPSEPPAAKPNAEKDPADEIVLEGGIGTLKEEEIEKPFQARWPEIQRCYQNIHNRHWFVQGKIELKVHVSDAGKPAAYIQSSDVGNYDTEKCLLDIVNTLEFPRPHGGKEAEFVFPIEFRGKNALMVWLPDDERVQKRMKTLKKAISACPAKDAPHEYKLTLYVVPGGKVASAGMAADGPIPHPFASCVVDSSLKWKTEDPSTSIAKVTLPMSKELY